eukprot:COSAG06_NODE_15858_length_1039_cov_1.470213_2_plen_159_part_01
MRGPPRRDAVVAGAALRACKMPVGDRMVGLVACMAVAALTSGQYSFSVFSGVRTPHSSSGPLCPAVVLPFTVTRSPQCHPMPLCLATGAQGAAAAHAGRPRHDWRLPVPLRAAGLDTWPSERSRRTACCGSCRVRWNVCSSRAVLGGGDAPPGAGHVPS